MLQFQQEVLSIHKFSKNKIELFIIYKNKLINIEIYQIRLI